MDDTHFKLQKESEGTSEQDIIFIIIMQFINKTDTAQVMKIQHRMRKYKNT